MVRVTCDDSDIKKQRIKVTIPTLLQFSLGGGTASFPPRFWPRLATSTSTGLTPSLTTRSCRYGRAFIVQFLYTRSTCQHWSRVSEELVALLVPQVSHRRIGRVIGTYRSLAVLLRRRGVIAVQVCELVFIEEQLDDLARLGYVSEVLVADDYILDLESRNQCQPRATIV